MAQLEHDLHQIVPAGWQVQPTLEALQLIAPNSVEANLFAEGGKKQLSQLATRLGLIEIKVEGVRKPFARFGRRNSMGGSSPSEAPEWREVSSYAPSQISYEASYDAIIDFIKGKKAEGLIVTATSMVSDKCLMINDLQIFDRGGNWTGEDWIGLDFKQLWRDSFKVGRTNYYGELIHNIERDRYLPDFFYHIRRPSGALAEYTSTYYLVRNFLGIPARIAVSVPGDWRIIEAALDGSEA